MAGPGLLPEGESTLGSLTPVPGLFPSSAQGKSRPPSSSPISALCSSLTLNTPTWNCHLSHVVSGFCVRLLGDGDPSLNSAPGNALKLGCWHSSFWRKSKSREQTSHPCSPWKLPREQSELCSRVKHIYNDSQTPLTGFALYCLQSMLP